MEQKDQNTALLVMDIQVATVKMIKESASFFNAMTRVTQTARNRKIPIIYVVGKFRKGYPDVSPDNKTFLMLKSGNRNIDMEEATKIDASVEPLPDDIIVIKKRVSAFTGSDLEVVLRSMGIKHLILSGIFTSGVVLSTLREAADKDYVITVLSDCCADMDEEVHRVLTTKVFSRQAEVVTSDDWCGESL